MIWFLLKGLARDRHRSLFPLLIVAGGVMITVLLYCFMLGMSNDLVQTNARLDTGHLKVMTRGYAELASQLPNDLALMDARQTLERLAQRYPDLEWVARIRFGGLLDFPDERGETRVQGPVIGMALDLFSPESGEIARLNLNQSVIRGRLPRQSGEIITSEQFAQSLGVTLGETATLISATANGSMAVQNFTLVGTVRFGIAMLDRNAILADLSDIQYALDLEDSAGEILGYFPGGLYQKQRADQIAQEFNRNEPKDEWGLVMITLREQNGLGEYLDLANLRLGIIMGVFVFVMSMVLWNAGLMSGLRRYGEIGVRLAFGESKGHVYRSLIAESLLIGVIGSLLGTLVGVAFSYYLQEHGIDISEMMEGSAMLWSNVIRAQVTLSGYYIGLIPGLLATLLGALISGIGIFRRQTAQLFKELEV